MDIRHTLTAIVPCTDLDASEEFYATLGFSLSQSEDPADEHYRMLDDGRGAAIHLARAGDAVIEKNGPAVKPWGMYEFALSDPDGSLVRVGWPARLRPQSP